MNTSIMNPTDAFAQRFPLVARPRPVCHPLDDRVADLRRRADQADRTGDLAAASAVFNLAALLASDCGLPDLARQWCHRQAHLYLRNHPLDAGNARHALEPLINLVRLHTRAGNGEHAYHVMDALYTAVASRTDVAIDGVVIPAAFTTDEAHRHVRRWLWTVLLATGARALAVAGRWSDAADRLREYRGIGRRMLDGRQVAVIAHASTGHVDHARELLRETEPGEPWENAVTACLTIYCGDSADADPLLTGYHQLGTPGPGLATFRTRLGLAYLDALGTHHPQAQRITTDLINQTIASRDGYATRDLLDHDHCRAALTKAQHGALTAHLNSCALDHGTIAERHLAVITAALSSTEDTIISSIETNR